VSFLKENISLSLNAIRSQLLRTILTVLIIATGIFSLIGTLTTIDALKSSINSNFASMGANTFTIRNREMSIRIGDNGKRPKPFKSITYNEALQFKKEYNFPALASVSTFASGNATLKYLSKKTNPNMRVLGSDENYIATSGYELESGRNFSAQEVQYGNHVAIIGKDIVNALFTEKEDPIDKIITIGSGKYKVVGILKSKGNSMGFSGDKLAILTLNNVRQYFSTPNATFTISVMTNNSQLMDVAIGEATGTFRVVRKLTTQAKDNFEISKSDNLANMLIENMRTVTLGATLIGIITLLGAAIGLMNIMLVSVSERTREIGIRKALGATKKVIRSQFLVEALVICQMGGILGTLLGIMLGNVIALFFGIGFIIPWLWIFLSIIICLFVGTLSGIYPAIKASQLDPIEALRFE
jgi:putative ABC transport system permease protein